jgi:4-hydroxy-tetrahydrodipicolinate synthase
MIIAPAVFPTAFQSVVRTIREGDSRTALRLFSDQILPFIHLFGIGDEISTTKALFKHLGIFRSDEVRPPLLPSTPERVKEVLLAYEVCQTASGVRQAV